MCVHWNITNILIALTALSRLEARRRRHCSFRSRLEIGSSGVSGSGSNRITSLSHPLRITSQVPITSLTRASIPIEVPESSFPFKSDFDRSPSLSSSPARIKSRSLPLEQDTRPVLPFDQTRLKEEVVVKPLTETIEEAKLQNTRLDSIVDESGKVRLDRDKTPVKVQKQSSFELPAILQNLFSSSGSSKYKDETCPKSSNSSFASLTSFLPLRLSQENLASGCSKLLNSNDERPRAYSLDKNKISRSESSVPLINSRDSLNSIMPSMDKENLKPDQSVSLDSSEKSNNLSPNKTFSSKTKIECTICSKEAAKKNIEDQARKEANNRRLSKRREMLRHQSSLDSVQSDRNSSESVRGWNGSLTRSESLDLEKSWFEDNSTSKMGSRVGDEGDTSLSTSQDSLQSDTGGAPTLHRYYHVFRDKELDQLIEKYVQNLHIISSYYDHANWCVIAEKVQVWTI